MREYGINQVGQGVQVFEPVTIGFPSRENIGRSDYRGTTIGRNAVLRPGTIIYCDVIIGDDFQSGHNCVIREKTRIGNRTIVGTATVIDGNTTIGSRVSLQSMVYIPTNTTIGDHVFIGPNAVLTNDRYPPSSGPLIGPTIKDGVAIGANTTILPGICIGEGAFVAAGSVVTRDVPDHTMAIGSPARIRDLPEEMRKRGE
ncbi:MULTISPECIES: acyltransferase [unclassified Methanoregula]|uniref:acyltransferase n=1 Tax=unclassified Methanoregula TaxID=2649730 RepID=UPI0009C44930|nr:MULTISPECIES: acyltransferase [unclassified Methanoregula]OPX61705.1 MAG: putative lipopolysaccharide biosynthesis O-acetyl transferase WbbJ [Methanoregula sp. PtaB.Bin085]OPY33986.1 MAG: putative lipopolysaccharide biosynthesis O-acetyl transferase WbbJ [Methanoregula sp. PtaU1.Bin006]